MMAMVIRPRRSVRGYSLLELMITLVIVGIMVGMAQIAFLRMQQQSTARDAMRKVVSLAREARANAILLGAAAGTNRVTNGNCPAEFFTPLALPLTGGFSGFLVDYNAAPDGAENNSRGMSVTYIARIRMTTNANTLPVYEIFCATENFTYSYKGNVIFDQPDSIPAPGLGNLMVLRFDSRGFLVNVNTNVVTIAMEETRGRQAQQNVLITGAGFSCLENSPGGGRCRN